uniref:J domain-containing protein n=1 Tax=Leptocylindrus danicus TaxID=163516 RepID=A0A7S2JUU2_9STRA
MTTTTLTSTSTARAACRINNLLLNKHLHRRSNNTSAAAAAALAPIEQQCMHRKNDDDDERHALYDARSSMHRMNMQTLQQRREYHLTTKTESVALAAGLAAVAVGAKAGQYGLRAFEEWQKNQPKEEPKAADDTTTKASASASGGAKASDSKKEKVNFFDQFGFGVGSKYYEGGFEDKMTRREAALILGVRESATVKRIKDAHRKILILNHPDTGGSTYMASKINEAKELLLKGKE